MAERFLSMRQVLERVGLSRTTLYERMDAGTFPQSVPLGPRRVAFVESQVDAWMQAQINTPVQRDVRRQRAQQVRAASC
jgi:prophage regulatory protein